LPGSIPTIPSIRSSYSTTTPSANGEAPETTKSPDEEALARLAGFTQHRLDFIPAEDTARLVVSYGFIYEMTHYLARHGEDSDAYLSVSKAHFIIQVLTLVEDLHELRGTHGFRYGPCERMCLPAHANYRHVPLSSLAVFPTARETLRCIRSSRRFRAVVHHVRRSQRQPRMEGVLESSTASSFRARGAIGRGRLRGTRLTTT
jgi:hypothetical protein